MAYVNKGIDSSLVPTSSQLTVSQTSTSSQIKVSASLPASFDWRNVPGIVNPIKNQARCGSCWAFSATGTLESAYALKNGFLPNLSEQNLVDCTYTTDGCDGGWYTTAWDYIKDKNKNAINTQTVYPYTSGTSGIV